jgi:phage portal protein BeeE
MDDVCPHGQTVAFELDAFYRGDLSARGAYYSQALAGGWMDVDEVRASEGDPPLSITEGTAADAAPPGN